MPPGQLVEVEILDYELEEMGFYNLQKEAQKLLENKEEFLAKSDWDQRDQLEKMILPTIKGLMEEDKVLARKIAFIIS